jgi:glycosyltransferase involved in cell wall biosynthesis
MKLTVLIPIYNTPAHHLLEAVHSILNQDDKGEHQIILIDDGSTNYQTLEVIRMLCTDGYTKGGITGILCDHRGTPAALNEGHSHVQTEYVALQGSDDISHPSRFRLQLEYLKRNPKTDVLGANIFSFYDDDLERKAIFRTKATEIALPMGGDKRWIVNHGSVIYRQSAVLAAGGYNEKFLRAQDVELWSRMITLGYKFRNLTQCLCAWRRKRPVKK